MSDPKTETVKRMAAATQDLRMRNEMFSPEIVCARVADSMVEAAEAAARAEGEQAEREPLERIGWMVCNKATHTHTGTVFHTREFADRSLTYYSNEHEVVEVFAALRSVAKEGERP